MTASVARAWRARAESRAAACAEVIEPSCVGRRSPMWRIRSASVHVDWAACTAATASWTTRRACASVSGAGCACAGPSGSVGSASGVRLGVPMTLGARGSRAPASLARACADHWRTSAARSSAPVSLPRRVAWLAHWRKVVSARASGARPNCASYSRARRAVSGLMLCRREEKVSITACPAPTISRPWPSWRWTHRTPNRRVSAFSVARAAIAEAAGRCRYRDIESSARHWPSDSRRTLCRIRLCTWSWGSPSRLVCWRNEAITHSRASSHRPPGW